jgi:hypothetical protein
MMMAQYTPVVRWFEQQWRPRRDLAVKVLRDIEDSWLQSNQPFPSREAVAILLNIFSFDFYNAGFLGNQGIRPDDLWRRSLGEWLSSVGSPESECVRLSPRRDGSEYNQLVDSLCAILSSAAGSWETVAPNKPSCEEVVQQLIDQLVIGRFATIGPG